MDEEREEAWKYRSESEFAEVRKLLDKGPRFHPVRIPPDWLSYVPFEGDEKTRERAFGHLYLVRLQIDDRLKMLERRMAESETLNACAEEGKTTGEATNYFSTNIRLSKEFYPKIEHLRAEMMKYNLAKSILETTASDGKAVTDIMKKNQKDLL